MHEYEVMADGVPIRLRVAGQGPVCVVLPGGPGMDWTYLRMPALEPDLTLVYVSPPGTGGSGRLPEDADWSIERYAQVARAVRADLPDGLRAGPVHLLGHSAGAMTALQYALDDPADLAGVILYDGAPVYGDDLFDELGVQIAQFAERHAGQPGMDDVLAALAEPGADRDDGLTQQLRRMTPAYFADYWAMQDVVQVWERDVRLHAVPEPPAWDVRDWLGQVAVRTLIMAGRYDFVCPPRWSEQMFDAIPGAAMHQFEQSGHFAHLEQPAQFAGLVRDFVTQTAGGRAS